MYKDRLNLVKCRYISECILNECYDLTICIRNYVLLKTSWNFEDLTSFISYVNTDAKLIALIDKRDSQLKQINQVFDGLMIMSNIEESLILRLYYIERKSIDEICNITNLSDRKIANLKKSALINFAISMGVEVFNEKKYE